MIEKFTPEELEIIKKELAEMPKDMQRRTVCQDMLKRWRIIFRARPEYSGVRPHEIEDAIFLIVDHTLANYEERDKYHKKNGKYRRSIFIKRELADEYKQMADELLDVVGKHYKERMIGNEGD